MIGTKKIVIKSSETNNLEVKKSRNAIVTLDINLKNVKGIHHMNKAFLEYLNSVMQNQQTHQRDILAVKQIFY